MLMLPARDPPLLASRAARLKRTVAARIGPIPPQLLPVLLVGVVVLQLFAGRAAIHIFLAEIDEVLLAEATPCFYARGHRFGERHGNAGLIGCIVMLTAWMIDRVTGGARGATLQGRHMVYEEVVWGRANGRRV